MATCASACKRMPAHHMIRMHIVDKYHCEMSRHGDGEKPSKSKHGQTKEPLWALIFHFSKKCLIQTPNLNLSMGCEPVAMKLLGHRANYQHLCGHNGTSHSPFAPDATSSASHVSRHGIVIRCGKQSSTIIDMIWWLEMNKSQTLIIHQ